MASAELRAFFSGLATDPEKLGAFMRDPDAALAASALDEEDKVAVLSGDPAALRARLHDPGDPPPFIILPGGIILFLAPPPVHWDFSQAFAQAFSKAFSKAFPQAFAEAFRQIFSSAVPDANADTKDAGDPTEHPRDGT